MFWFWLMLLLFVAAIAFLPLWPYSRARRLGYGPTISVSILLIILLLLWWIGIIIVALPWETYGPY